MNEKLKLLKEPMPKCMNCRSYLNYKIRVDDYFGVVYWNNKFICPKCGAQFGKPRLHGKLSILRGI